MCLGIYRFRDLGFGGKGVNLHVVRLTLLIVHVSLNQTHLKAQKLVDLACSWFQFSGF